MRFSLKSRVVFPVDGPPIENGAVTIEGDRIVAVSNKPDAGNFIDLGWTALLPGLVNAHTHLEFSYLQRPLGSKGMPLVDWIRLVIAERAGSDRLPLGALQLGLRECIAAGVTTIGEIATSMPGCIPGHDMTVFAEVIGFSRARADSAFSHVVGRLDFMRQAFDTLNDCENLLPRFGVSPHAPYTVSPDLLRRLVDLACQRNLPMAMHLAESREELELLRTNSGPFRELLEERSMWDMEAIPTGSKPLDYLRMLSEAPRAILIHGNYLDFHELNFLGTNRTQMSLVYCPRTHAFLGHEPYPLAAALGAHVRVALGTDSRASNPDLSLLAEMRHLALAYDWLDPATVLRMGTLSGAKALGRDAEVGSIAPGKLANLIALPITDERLTKSNEILASILAADTAPSAVYLAGCRLNS